jgi:hypothetical protein
MEKENLKRIFEFLEEKEEHNPPFLWKWKNNIPLIEEDLNVKGDLNLAYSKIRSFPEGLKVAGDLDLQDSYVKSLPKGLEVGGVLSLIGTYMTTLQKGLEVGGDLYIHGTDLKKYTKQQLREMIKPGFIKGRIYTGYE